MNGLFVHLLETLFSLVSYSIAMELTFLNLFSSYVVALLIVTPFFKLNIFFILSSRKSFRLSTRFLIFVGFVMSLAALLSMM